MKEKKQTGTNNNVPPTPVEKQPSWFKRKLIPFMGKVGNQRHLTAIRDSFGTLIPLIIAGAIGILTLTIGFGGWGSENVSVLGWLFMATHWDQYQALDDGVSISTIPEWKDGAWNEISNIGVQIFSPLNAVSLGMMSIYISFLMGYFLGVSRQHKSPILVGFASFATWAILINVNTYFVNANGLLVAILGGIAGAELFMAFTKVRALEIRLPDGVPPAVGKSFAVFLPMLFTLVVFSIFNTVIWAIAKEQAWEVTASNVSTFSLLKIDQITDKHFLSDALGYYGLYGSSVDDTYGNALKNGADLSIALDNAEAIWDANGATYTIVEQALASELITPEQSIDAIAALDEIRLTYDTMFYNAYHAANNEAADAIVAGAYQTILDKLNMIDDESVRSIVINQILYSTNSKFSLTASGQNWTDISATMNQDAEQAAATSIVVFHYTTIKVATSSFGTGALIFMAIQAPFMGLASSDAGIWLALLFAFLVSFFWFFGVHGSNVMAGIFDPIWLSLLATNVAIFQSVGNPEIAQPLMSVYARPIIDSYMYIGGTGVTLALILGVMIFSKKRELKEVSKYAAPAGIFQINEPVIFGFPIVINFVWFVPFVVTPMLTLAWISFGITSGLVYPAYISMPWTAPWILGALLNNGLQSPFWSLFFALGAFAIGFAMYFPFIMIDNAQYDRKRRESGDAAPEELALWNVQKQNKEAKANIADAFKNGEISKEESETLALQAKADFDEIMPIVKAAFDAWKIQDSLVYKEKAHLDKEEYKRLKSEIKETEKATKAAKKLEKEKQKTESKK